jgi:periodic tryptophan protein 2
MHGGAFCTIVLQFCNLLGAVYKRGNVVFMCDGNTLVSPVGNKVTLHDLNTHRAHTLPVEARLDIVHVAISGNGLNALLVTAG